MAYNNPRPRKIMSEVGKEFPILNGMSMMSAPSTASASPGPQISILDRGNTLGSGLMQTQQGQSLSSTIGHQYQQQQQQQGVQSLSQHLQSQEADKDKEASSEPQTAIFRPDDTADWKERLRMSHEAEQARSGLSGSSTSGTSAWDRQAREDDDEGKDEDGEVEDEETSVLGDGDGTKAWKAKRTLRKSVTLSD